MSFGCHNDFVSGGATPYEVPRSFCFPFLTPSFRLSLLDADESRGSVAHYLKCKLTFPFIIINDARLSLNCIKSLWQWNSSVYETSEVRESSPKPINVNGLMTNRHSISTTMMTMIRALHFQSIRLFSRFRTI